MTDALANARASARTALTAVVLVATSVWTGWAVAQTNTAEMAGIVRDQNSS